MSEETQPRQEQQGSRLAEMFGFVTPEDRAKWDQQRRAAQVRDQTSVSKSYSKASLNSLLEFGETNVKARLSAAHRVLAQREFDEGHERKVRQGMEGQLITEAVSYESKDDRDLIGDDDPGMEMGG